MDTELSGGWKAGIEDRRTSYVFSYQSSKQSFSEYFRKRSVNSHSYERQRVVCCGKEWETETCIQNAV